MDELFQFRPVGVIRSCFGEKFGIPRQPGLVPSARATLELVAPFNQPEAVRGLAAFSHLWILFVFHASARDQWKATVRPPRLGGNERLGVFASRSNFRPNPIGLSVVALLAVETAGDCVALTLQGGDFLDGTPVLDIKPYIPYADAVADAQGSYAHVKPAAELCVVFTPEAAEACEALEGEKRPALCQLIEDMLRFNVRPAYQGDDPERVFGTKVFDLDVRWRQSGCTVTVMELVQRDEE